MRQRFAFPLALAILVCALAVPGAGRAAITEPYTALGSEPVVAGLVHEWGTARTDIAQQQINVLRVAQGAADLRFQLGLAHDRVNAREWTTNQSLRDSGSGQRVVAAINGDYWQQSDAGVISGHGLNIRNGELITAPPGPMAAFGLKADGQPIIGEPTLVAQVALPDATVLPITRVNQSRADGDLVLYTPHFDGSTRTDASGTEVVIDGVPMPLAANGIHAGTVRAVNAGAGDTPLAAGRLVLSGTGDAATALAALGVGQQVTLTLSLDADWSEVVTAVGGGPVLVHGGEIFGTPTSLFPNPRTAIGVLATGELILVTVDGRSETSGGLYLDEIAALMRSLGAQEAINLDGGGSTTMLVDPEGAAPLAIVNDPSDGYERRVNTSLELISTAPGLPTVTAPVARLKAGAAAGKNDAAIQLSWAAADADGQIVSTELQRLGGDGTWQDVMLPLPTAQLVGRRLAFGKRNQFRVRVTDNDGNQSPWSVGPTYRVVAFNERDAALQRVGRWPVDPQQSAIGGHLARSRIKSGADLRVALPFTGLQVAWVAPTDSLGGTGNVLIDGTSVAIVDLHSAYRRARLVLFVSPLAAGAGSTPAVERMIEVRNVSTGARPFVGLDAFLVLVAE